MSRSVRHTPIFGITKAESAAADKRHWNHAFRKRSKALLRSEPEGALPMNIRKETEVWGGAKEGRSYWRFDSHTFTRKHREVWMRK